MTPDATYLPLAGNVIYPLPLAEGGTLLVDAGPDVEGTWEVASAAVAPSEVRVVLITHAHVDHAGLPPAPAAEVLPLPDRGARTASDEASRAAPQAMHSVNGKRRVARWRGVAASTQSGRGR